MYTATRIEHLTFLFRLNCCLF